ncbi:hypothetical protein B0H16DRAFT_1477881 [Mycena metata]|uniref:Uncharacterized protein n=1 Tax=Mycena metata TaxID=1033252 RepID=A0AAD7H8L8_9AGAR|nr:hypothetical protein B0H16DRAFT_1477881 [Mycena metata]
MRSDFTVIKLNVPQPYINSVRSTNPKPQLRRHRGGWVFATNLYAMTFPNVVSTPRGWQTQIGPTPWRLIAVSTPRGWQTQIGPTHNQGRGGSGRNDSTDEKKVAASKSENKKKVAGDSKKKWRPTEKKSGGGRVFRHFFFTSTSERKVAALG